MYKERLKQFCKLLTHSGRLFVLLLTVLLIAGNVCVAKAETTISGDYKKIAQSGRLALYYNEKETSVAVQDLQSGYLWSSSVRSDQYDVNSLTPQFKENVRSLFNINYTNLKSGDGNVITTSAQGLRPKITQKNIDNGISLSYEIDLIKVKITVDVTLEDDGLKIQVPAENLKEDGEFGIVSLEMLPFFGAAADNTDGYIFYPDGSGAIMDFKDGAHVGANRKSWNIYGSDISEYMANDDRENAVMPVFGVRQQDNAFLAVVTEGEYDTAIDLVPSGTVGTLNRICPEITFRRYLIDPRVKKKVVKKYDKKPLNVKHTVKYYFLNGSSADYSGMANLYRSYLVKTDNLNKKFSAKDKLPLGLDLFMGINEKGLLFNKFISMTTFGQAQNIMEKFKNKGVEAINTSLEGWTKEGYDTVPLQFPPNSKLGGEKGLKQLADYTNRNNVKLYLRTNLIDAISKYGGFSKRNDVVYQANGLIVTDARKEYFTFNPTAMFNKFVKEFLPQAHKYNISGVNFTYFGNFVYSDYNKKAPSTREQTAKVYDDIMDKTKTEIGSAAATGGNIYAIKSADRLLRVPIKDTGYFLTTEVIPFYQMVVHGLAAYSSEAGNLSNDFAREKLKWVEYGCMPYFEMTYNSPKELKYTEYNRLFTSSYDEWLDTASDVYKEFNERLGGVWSQYIIRHEKVAEDVYKVTYEDGTQVYVNYTSEPVKVDNFSVKAMDYLVVEKGGKTR